MASRDSSIHEKTAAESTKDSAATLVEDHGPLDSAKAERTHRVKGSHHGLEAFEREDLDHVASRLGLEGHRLAGERVNAFAGLGGWLVHALDLHESGDREDA